MRNSRVEPRSLTYLVPEHGPHAYTRKSVSSTHMCVLFSQGGLGLFDSLLPLYHTQGARGETYNDVGYGGKREVRSKSWFLEVQLIELFAMKGKCNTIK